MDDKLLEKYDWLQLHAFDGLDKKEALEHQQLRSKIVDMMEKAQRYDMLMSDDTIQAGYSFKTIQDLEKENKQLKILNYKLEEDNKKLKQVIEKIVDESVILGAGRIEELEQLLSEVEK